METPGAGPSRLQPPITPKSKRRSWFHFGSSSTTPPPPLPTSQMEELELGPVTPRQSKDSARIPEEEVLDIDGRLEPKSIKKKKKKSKGGTGTIDGEGEVVRMMDLKPPAPSRKGSGSGSDTSSRTELGIGTVCHVPSFSTLLISRHIQSGHSQGQQVIEHMFLILSTLHPVLHQSNNRDLIVHPQCPQTRKKNNLSSLQTDHCPLSHLHNGRQHPQQHPLGSTLHPALPLKRHTIPQPRSVLR